MIQKLGRIGLFGALLAVVGIGVVAWQAPIVAGGIALTLAGVALVVKGVLDGVMARFGFA